MPNFRNQVTVIRMRKTGSMACAAPEAMSRAGAALTMPPVQAAEPAEAVSACRQFLQRTTLRALMRPQQAIVTLMHSQTIGEALEVGHMRVCGPCGTHSHMVCIAVMAARCAPHAVDRTMSLNRPSRCRSWRKRTSCLRRWWSRTGLRTLGRLRSARAARSDRPSSVGSTSPTSSLPCSHVRAQVPVPVLCVMLHS